MNNVSRGLLVVGIAAVLSACASNPTNLGELETARAIVPQVEASPRAGIAAADISEARKALNRADGIVAKAGSLDPKELSEVKYEADMANKYAQIANEKILAAQAKEELEHGTAERQQVLLEARNREAQLANQRAQVLEQHANSLEQALKDLQAKKTERGLVLTLGDVLFDTGKATLKPGAYATIDRLATALKEVPDRKVLIEGHTDSVGADSYNQTLSENRAAAVQTALMERGVANAQIAALGKGEGFPVAGNDNSAGRQQNRRVELIFTEDSTRTASDGD